MAKAFRDRPRWQRWMMIGGWGFVAMVILSMIFGPDPERDPGEEVAADAATDAQMIAFRSRLSGMAAGCDRAQTAVAEGLGNIASGDRIALARNAQQMEDACKSAWLSVDDLDAPDGVSDAQEDAINQAREDCKMAFYSRGEVAESLIPVIDGDSRPSVLAGISDDMAAMQGDALRCAQAMAKLTPPAAAPSAAASADQ